MSFQGGVQKLRLENSTAARLRKISVWSLSYGQNGALKSFQEKCHRKGCFLVGRAWYVGVTDRLYSRGMSVVCHGNGNKVLKDIQNMDGSIRERACRFVDGKI